MKRLSRIFRPFLLVLVTVLATVWVHRRVDALRDRELPYVDSVSDIGIVSPDAVTESEFERYVHVLESMQADHSLGIDAAADREAMKVEEFRDIERRVQRSDLLVERLRESLKRKAESVWDSRRAQLATPTQSPPVPEL
ncbi:MAG: hypothetical protein ACREQJ_09355 [Candidatus Binatia bacterium]